MTRINPSEIHQGTPHGVENRFVDLVVGSLNRWGNRLLFDQPAGERSYTYAEAAELVAQIIHVFAEHGIGKDAGVGALAGNKAEAWMIAVAPQIAGGHYAALPARSSADDLVYIVENADLRAIVVDPDLDELGAQVIERCPGLKVFGLGPSELGPDLLALARRSGYRRLVAGDDIRPDDLSHLWYTGGTTGRPKAAVHTHRSLTESVLRYLCGYELPTPNRYAAMGPISHSGYPHMQWPLVTGGSTTVFPFDPERFARLTAEKKLTFTVGVPTMMYSILDYAERNPVDLSSLRCFLYGGSPIAPDRIGGLVDRFGKVFTQMYGQSESLGAGTVLAADEHDPSRPDRIMSCGRPVAAAQVTLLDDDLNPVGPGEVGELCVRAPSMMAGYWKEPELTKEAFAGGWFHSGDLATVDDEGYYTIVDRKKDMIVSGGFNVFPAEIENVLMADPTVAVAAVIGVPDPRWGEAVRAVVVPATGATIDVQSLTELVRRKKGGVYTPKAIDVRETMPLTAAGKVDKKVLRKPYWEGQARRV